MGKLNFDFGKNWKNFSVNALQGVNLTQSMQDFQTLVGSADLKGKSFLDIGFGQGLGLLNATVLGAAAVGCDINPTCNEVLKLNKQHFPMLPNVEIPVVVGSILEADTVSRIKSHRTNFDIVHAWGVLHHTGEMWKAIDICTEFVAPDGLLILSIYNRHWSSFSWKCIKWCYNISPQFVKWLMVKSFYLIIYVAKFLVTGKNPLKKERGMNFYYDIIDWLGGYPYEYASIAEICNYLETNNFTSISVKKAKVPTGCNEFHFAPKAK